LGATGPASTSEAGLSRRTDGKGPSEGGKLVVQSIQVGEKAVQNYRFETRTPGGHSSLPVRDNAIYELADTLTKLRDYDFPLELWEATQAFFSRAGAARGDELGPAMQAIAAVRDRVNGSRQGRLNGSRLLIAQDWPLAAGSPPPASAGRVKGAEPFRFRRSRPLTLPSTRAPGLIEAAIRGGGPRALR
jgi:hypothetical protein